MSWKMSWQRSPKLRPNRWDGLLALAVLLLALGLGVKTWLGGSSQNLTAVISVDGAVVETITISGQTSAERELTANGYTLHLHLTTDGAAITESDCPTQDCVRTGTITRSGQSIVCLPARIIIRLEGGRSGNGPDILIG